MMDERMFGLYSGPDEFSSRMKEQSRYNLYVLHHRLPGLVHHEAKNFGAWEPWTAGYREAARQIIEEVKVKVYNDGWNEVRPALAITLASDRMIFLNDQGS
jgi:hypothetical protein